MSFSDFLLILHGLLVIGFTIRILLRDDLTPPSRLAWFIVLNLFPYGGSLLYFLFGEVDIGHHAREVHERIVSDIRARVPGWFGNWDEIEPYIDPAWRAPFRYAASVNGFDPVGGNRAELMPDADATLERMVADIDAATDHVHVLYYIWLEDGTGTAIAEALMRAAGRGVTCRALADGLGSRAMTSSPLWKRMREAGVQTAVTLPLSRLLRTLLLSRLDLRNHRKITVIDGCVTWCGSRNSADPEFRIKAKYAPWVDIMLRFEGPVVAQKQALFASDWIAATGESFDGFHASTEPLPGGFVAQAFGDGPTERQGATPHLFVSLISSASERLVMTTPYFVPDASVLEALCSVALRGVEVDLIFPERNDSWVVAAASHSYYRKLLRAGCRIHHFQGGLLHAKTLTIDGNLSLIGSTNMDLRSFDLNYENNILLQDEATTTAIFTRQNEYLADSVPVTRQEVHDWSRSRRIWNNVIATVGPVL